MELSTKPLQIIAPWSLRASRDSAVISGGERNIKERNMEAVLQRNKSWKKCKMHSVMALGCKWVDKDLDWIFYFKMNEKLWLAQVKDYFYSLEMQRAERVHQWEAIAGLTGWYHTEIELIIDIFVHVWVHWNGVSVCKLAISLVF